jgi:hypothetical protein
METSSHLTDHHIQEYLHTQVMTENLKLHLDSCAQCRTRLENYRLLTNSLQTNDPIAPLRIDLATSVAHAVFVHKPTVSPLEKVLFVTTAILILVVLYYSRGLFTSISLTSLLMFVPLALFTWLSLMEVGLLKHRLLKLR